MSSRCRIRQESEIQKAEHHGQGATPSMTSLTLGILRDLAASAAIRSANSVGADNPLVLEHPIRHFMWSRLPMPRTKTVLISARRRRRVIDGVDGRPERPGESVV